MGKDIGQIYKHSQYQLSNSSLKAPVSSSSEHKTTSAFSLITTNFASVTDKHQKHYVLYNHNTIQNDETITNNDNIQSFETANKKIITFQPI